MSSPYPAHTAILKVEIARFLALMRSLRAWEPRMKAPATKKRLAFQLRWIYDNEPPRSQAPEKLVGALVVRPKTRAQVLRLAAARSFVGGLPYEPERLEDERDGFYEAHQIDGENLSQLNRALAGFLGGKRDKGTFSSRARASQRAADHEAWAKA
jgi:hypothetical protein